MVWQYKCFTQEIVKAAGKITGTDLPTTRSAVVLTRSEPSFRVPIILVTSYNYYLNKALLNLPVREIEILQHQN